MALWPFRKHTPTEPTDVAEAREMRAEASAKHREAVLRGFEVSQLTSYLAERRALNHFGDSIQISFTRRRA